MHSGNRLNIKSGTVPIIFIKKEYLREKERQKKVRDLIVAVGTVI